MVERNQLVVETTAKTSDIKGAKGILENIRAGSIVVVDRGYNNYSLFQRLTDKRVDHAPLRQGLIEADSEGCLGLYTMEFKPKNIARIQGQPLWNSGRSPSENFRNSEACGRAHSL